MVTHHKNSIVSAACLLATLSGAGTASGQKAVVLERDAVRDRMASHQAQEAVHLLKPQGWKLEGGIVWYPHHAHQACAEVRLRNPSGPEQVEFFPFKSYVWMTNWVVPFPRGSNYLGSEVQPPVADAREYIQNYVLVHFRRGARVVGYQALPEVARAVGGNTPGLNVLAGRTRIEYVVGNQPVEEDVYAVVGVHKADLGFGPTWSWVPDRVFGVRATKGQLDEQSKLLMTVVNSAKFNPNWYAEYRYVCDLFMQRMHQGIADAGRLSAQIARNSDDIRRMYSESYRKQQESQDRISARFSDYIRGVERFHNPNERYPVQLPSGYSYVWANPNGQYILSNSAGQNPNVGSTQNWQLLKRVD